MNKWEQIVTSPGFRMLLGIVLVGMIFAVGYLMDPHFHG